MNGLLLLDLFTNQIHIYAAYIHILHIYIHVCVCVHFIEGFPLFIGAGLQVTVILVKTHHPKAQPHTSPEEF